MQFYLITDPQTIDDYSKKTQYELLESACQRLGVEFKPVLSSEYDIFQPAKLGAGALLYRHVKSENAKTIEKLLINEQVATFYQHFRIAIGARRSSYYNNIRAGLSVIPTFPMLPRDELEMQQVAQTLGSYPLIIKVLGGSKGVGVIRVDSEQSFRSVIDYLKTQSVRVLIRKYIEHSHYGRLIVVGDKVVASNRTAVPRDEFRSNTIANVDENRKPFVFSKEVEDLAVQAVQSDGLYFGGVDLLFEDGTDQAYIAEVNYPCQFEYAQQITGIDVAYEMVKFLTQRAAINV